MKAASRWLAIVVVIAGLLGLGWVQTSRRPETARWEYLSYQASSIGPSDQEMNNLGVEGWELIAIDSGGEQRAPRFVFKRKK
jgi:hypothetical protein